jgi:hypothetical protein
MLVTLWLELLLHLKSINDAQSLRATRWQSMKWLTEYFSARVMIVSLLKIRWRLSAAECELARRDRYRTEVDVMHICWPGKNRFTAQR